ISLNAAVLSPSPDVAVGSFFRTPTLREFCPAAILVGGTPFEFNRVQLVRLVILVAVLVFMCIVASRAKLVPGRLQSVVEILIDFVNTQIIGNTIGLREGRRFAPMLITMFFFIFAMNLGGVIP